MLNDERRRERIIIEEVRFGFEKGYSSIINNIINIIIGGRSGR